MSPLDPASPALAQAIRDLREASGLTQEEVALEAGITLGAFWKIENARSNPTWTTVERIAESLEISLVELAHAVEDVG